jgi:hypothetical protein
MARSNLILVNKSLDWTDILKAELHNYSRQDFIHFTVNTYVKTFPLEFKQICQKNKKIKNTRRDHFATWRGPGFDEGFDFRWGTSLPSRLHNVLDNLLEPRLFYSNKEMLWFMRTFPVFAIPQKI